MLFLVLRALALLALGATFGFAVNAARPDGVSLRGFAAPNTCGLDENEGAKGSPIEVFAPREAEALCADPLVVVADVRAAEIYAQGHVAGAIHLPCSATEQVAVAAEQHLREKELLLVYGEQTDDAFRVAEQMRTRLGMSKLRIAVLEGGFSAWQGAGLACAAGECPNCGGDRGDHDASDHSHPASEPSVNEPKEEAPP